MVEEISKLTRSSLIIIGHSGAGKTTLADLISRHYRANVIEVGYQVVKEAAQQNRLITPLEYADAKLRAGKYYHFVEQIAACIDYTKPIIIVGPRQVQEIRFFRDILDSTIVIGLDAPNRIRELRRCTPEELRKGGSTWLQHRDEVERSWGVENTLKIADVVLDATKPQWQLLLQTNQVLKELGNTATQQSTSYHFLQGIGGLLKKANSSSQMGGHR
jgi:adenylate kinase family enzyme